ncbi:MAG: IPExxxVDY family protein [Bacteroidota bacterium]
MPKRKLHIDTDYDFFLFGICCPVKPYRLCWALNNQLKVSFQKTEDWMLGSENQKNIFGFPVFFFRDEDLFADYRLIVNKIKNKIFLPEYKQADYLLMIRKGIPSLGKKIILQKIRNISFIQIVFEINPQEIKSRDLSSR